MIQIGIDFMFYIFSFQTSIKIQGNIRWRYDGDTMTNLKTPD